MKVFYNYFNSDYAEEANMELWDIYDNCFNKTCRTHVRGEQLVQGDNHLVVHIYPVNSKGEILIQKRQDTLGWKPGYWAATGGSAVVGEDAWTACRRELQEELGILAETENSENCLMVKRHDNFCTVWIIRTDIRLEQLILQSAEVADVKWATPMEIRNMVKEDTFIDYDYLEYLFNFIRNKD